MEDAINELTKMLIKQDIKDKENGIEYVKVPMINIIRLNIKVLKLLQKLKL